MNITSFITALKERLNNYKIANGYTHFKEYDVITTETPKYFKVYRREVNFDGTHRDSITAFIDKATGDILKPASFKVPAKHARGNVNSAANGMEAIDAGGFVRYLK